MSVAEQTIREARGMEARNPANGEVIGHVSRMDELAARGELARVRAAQPEWAARPLSERTAVLRRFARVLAERGIEVARWLSEENGKPVVEAFETEVLPLVYLTSYFTEHAGRILAPRRIRLKLFRHKWSEVTYRPRGVVYVISPWNFPLTIPMGEVVMALVAGNTVLHKPASLTPLIAVRFRELLMEAGLPEDAYRVITASGEVAFELIGPSVDYVNFTGSTEVGRKVSARCGELLIPCSMELGGKDAAILLDDADLERAANGLVWGAFANSGQACASVERAYVPRAIHGAFVQRVVDRTRALRQGEPGGLDVDLGSMTDPDQRDLVHAHVTQARRAGARVLTGGELPDGPGLFYPPTVIADVTDDMDVTRQETFGPVLPILIYDDLDDAIARINDSPYGLTASVFGQDEARAREVAERIEAGTVMINEVLYTHGLAETPWGGVKQSGVGFVHSDDGLRTLTQRIHLHGNRLPPPSREATWFPYTPNLLDLLSSASRVIAERGLGRRVRKLFQEIVARTSSRRRDR